MPTMAQVADIANYVYNTSDIGAKDNVQNLTLDYDKAAELGFTGTNFDIWSGEESGGSAAGNRHFGSNASYADNSTRVYTTLLTVCIGD